MSTFTNIHCEACGGPGATLAADGWNLCATHFLRRRPSRKWFDRETGELIPLPSGAVVHEQPPVRYPPVSASEIVVEPVDPVPGVEPWGCRSYRVGHQVHMVQGLRSANDLEGRESCSIVAVESNGWFTLEMDGTGERRRFWHHDLSRVLERAGRRLTLQERWHTLRIGGRPISISSEATPCVHEDPTGPLHERMETHGGFLVSGEEALRLSSAGEGSRED